MDSRTRAIGILSGLHIAARVMASKAKHRLARLRTGQSERTGGALMMMMLIALGIVAATGIAATIVELLRDGHRRLPTRAG
jgi:hypothetical protein